jgi:hypothetical protein
MIEYTRNYLFVVTTLSYIFHTFYKRFKEMDLQLSTISHKNHNDLVLKHYFFLNYYEE